MNEENQAQEASEQEQPEQTFTFVLSASETQMLGKILGEASYNDSVHLVNTLNAQLASQN